MQLSGLTQRSHQHHAQKMVNTASSKTSGGHCHGSARPHSTHNHVYIYIYIHDIHIYIYIEVMHIFVMYQTIIIHTVNMQLNVNMFTFFFRCGPDVDVEMFGVFSWKEHLQTISITYLEIGVFTQHGRTSNAARKPKKKQKTHSQWHSKSPDIATTCKGII